MTEPLRVDLAGIDCVGPRGAVWSLPHGGDLDANLVTLGPGDRVEAHTNHEVDVLVVGVAGTGHVVVDGQRLRLDASSLVHVPKHLVRAIEADAAGPLVYLTVHRARAPLGLIARPPTGASRGAGAAG